MFTDILKFKKEHEDKAIVIVDKYLQETLTNSYEGVICISGISGSGKTEVAWWIAQKLYRLGISTHKINLDRYYKTEVNERKLVREETNIIGHLEMDWTKISEELSFWEKTDIKVLIFEGLYAGYINGISFFLDTDLKEAEKFRIERGKEKEETDWRKYVIKKENKDVLSTKDKCFCIIK